MDRQLEVHIGSSPEQILAILEARQASLLSQREFLAAELAATDKLLEDTEARLAEQRTLSELDRSWQ